MMQMNHHRRHLLVLLLAFLFASFAFAEESHHGFDLEALARASAQYGALRAEYGEAKGTAEWDAWLHREMDSSARAYWSAWSVWWEEFQADESGKLQARFHTLESRFSTEAHFGDVPDATQETREGVTLDDYAKIVVAMSRTPGADPDAVARAHGLDGLDHFNRVNQAWAAAMAEDTTFALTTQYGVLYQKHAGADFAAEQEQKLADLLAARNRPEAEEEAPSRSEPPSASDYSAELNSAVPGDRWNAARQLTRICGLYRRFDAKKGDEREAHCSDPAIETRLRPVLVELLEGFDDRHVGLASGVISMLEDVGLRTSSMKRSAQKALERARARHAEIENEYRPIQHQKVPQRVLLRTQLDTHAGAIEELERELSNW